MDLKEDMEADLSLDDIDDTGDKPLKSRETSNGAVQVRVDAKGKGKAMGNKPSSTTPQASSTLSTSISSTPSVLPSIVPPRHIPDSPTIGSDHPGNALLTGTIPFVDIDAAPRAMAAASPRPRPKLRLGNSVDPTIARVVPTSGNGTFQYTDTLHHMDVDESSFEVCDHLCYSIL